MLHSGHSGQSFVSQYCNKVHCVDITGTSEEPSTIVALVIHTLLAIQEQPTLSRARRRQSHGERAGGER